MKYPISIPSSRSPFIVCLAVITMGVLTLLWAPSMTFMALSTTTYQDRLTFAAKANIHNILFLSDAPHDHFGNTTGLLMDQLSILHRAVLVLDQNLIIRYVDIVPLGQLPDFDQALRVSRSILAHTSQGVMP